MVLLISLLLSACGSQSQRPAPVTETTVGTEPPKEEVKTFGYDNSGFGSQPGQGSGPALPVEPAPISEQAPASQASSKTVLALLQTAEGQERAGNKAGAAATLERALRIQPRNAVLWYRLANVRYQQGQYSRAGSLAGKSNSLAGGNSSLRRNNWLLIAKVKRAQGDEYGAREAESKASGGLY
jgi:tetratricopeptide (TPR) repeat protein